MTTPALAVAVSVLAPVNEPGPDPRATVTVSVLSLATRLPNWSSMSTFTAGLIAAPAVVLLGSCAKTSWLAAAGVIVKLLDEGPLRLFVAFSLRV